MSSIFNALKEKDAASLGLAAMPGIFVLLWSTGFIGAKFGLLTPSHSPSYLSVLYSR